LLEGNLRGTLPPALAAVNANGMPIH
jgi:hypothetical protein